MKAALPDWVTSLSKLSGVSSTAPEAAAAPAKAPKAPSVQSSAPALSFDELLANSIVQKEEFIGRKLSDLEKEDLKLKLSKLMK